VKLIPIYNKIIQENVDVDYMKRMGISFLKFKPDQINDFVRWISIFPKSGKAPNGLSKEFEFIKFLKKQSDAYQEYNMISQNIANTFSHWDESDINRIVDGFFKTKNSKIENLTIGNLTFINDSLMAESRFKLTSKKISEFLDKFTGFHKKALTGKFEIYFKPADALRAKATYKSQLDQIWIKETYAREIDTVAYASLLYIIVHELGHRYEYKHGSPSGFVASKFYTTRYSQTDTMSFGTESFAEIFAISFFGVQKYPQYESQIAQFEKIM
jgi:hypothetical protein